MMFTAQQDEQDDTGKEKQIKKKKADKTHRLAHLQRIWLSYFICKEHV